MRKTFKKYFLPHEDNDHRPHFLRARGALVILTLILFFEAAYLVQTFVILPRSDFFAAVLSSVLIDQTNARRADERLATLTVNPKLEAAAKLKADDMAARGYFAHNTPDGRTPWWFIDQMGYFYDAAGENLAVNFTESSDVTDAWMRSPLHRANIVNGNFTEIGIATAQGVYKGKEAIFVVQMFGRPASPLVVALSTPPPAPLPPKVVLNTNGNATLRPPVKPTRVVTPILAATGAATSSAATASTSLSMTTTTPSVVAGASETIVAGNEVTTLTPTPAPSMPAETASVSTASVWEEFLASPRRVTTGVQIFFGILIAFALGLLAFFLRHHTHAPELVLNGVLLLTIITGLGLFNYLVSATMGAVY